MSKPNGEDPSPQIPGDGPLAHLLTEILETQILLVQAVAGSMTLRRRQKLDLASDLMGLVEHLRMLLNTHLPGTDPPSKPPD